MTTAHVIIDLNRPVSNITIYKELDDQQIDFRIWHSIPDPDSVIRSIGLSHKQIVSYARDEGLLEICILEEDVMFATPKGWEYFLSNKPVDFDLYLGGTYGLNVSALKRITKEPGATEIHNFAGLHCYIIHQRYYDRFLAQPENKHIDDQPGMGKFFVCYPFAALQHPGWSSNGRTMVNYNYRLEEHIYGHK